jgi:hypothetical protein
MSFSMTLKELLTNPPGKGSAHVAARFRIRDSLIAVFRAAIGDPERRRRFSLSVWGKGPYIVLVKVPSEGLPVDYDVIFTLDYGAGRATAGAQVRLYCNSPGWVFTYGWVAAHDGALAPGWGPALGKEVTGVRPRTTNPTEELGFDKVVYQAALWLLGPGGMLSSADADRLAGETVGRTPPDPKDPALTAAAKAAEYDREKKKARLARKKTRVEARKAEEALRAAREEDRRNAGHQRKQATAPAAKAATKAGVRAATPAATVKAAKPAGKVGTARRRGGKGIYRSGET